MRSAILEKGKQYYTHMDKVFNAIENEQLKYNWLITDCECYLEGKSINEMFSKEYIWILGEQLTEIISKDDNLVQKFRSNLPLSEDLSALNTRNNRKG